MSTSHILSSTGFSSEWNTDSCPQEIMLAERGTDNKQIYKYTIKDLQLPMNENKAGKKLLSEKGCYFWERVQKKNYSGEISPGKNYP